MPWEAIAYGAGLFVSLLALAGLVRDIVQNERRNRERRAALFPIVQLDLGRGRRRQVARRYRGWTR